MTRQQQAALPPSRPPGQVSDHADAWRQDVGARRRADSRARVLQAAGELFQARPYSAVSVERIAEAAGVGPATIYNRFRSKAMIVAYLMQDAVAGLIQAAEADIAAALTTTDAVRRHFVRLSALAQERGPWFGALLAAAIEVYGGGEGLRPETDIRLVAPLPHPLLLLLEAGQRTGEVATSVNPAAAANMVTNAFCMRVVRREGVDEAGKELAELLLFGVRGDRA